MKKQKPRVVSLFSGAGGMDIGFIKSGFDIVWANDFSPWAVESYKHNIGDHIHLGDITKIKSSDIPDDIDVVIGGFPCQGFSIANTNRNIEDERNFLYREMLRIIKDKKPSFFVAENVKGILSLGGGEIFKMIKKDFQNLGYKIDAKVLNSAKFGVPQARERVIILGNNIGVENVFPKETHFQNNHNGTLKNNNKLPLAKTVQNAIGELSNIKLSEKPKKFKGKKLYNHIARTNVSDEFYGRKYKLDQAVICDYLKDWRSKGKISTKEIDKILGYNHTAGHWFRKDNNSGSIPNAQAWWKLKKILGFDDKFDKEVTTYVKKKIKFEQSLRITNWDRPSDTITATGPEIHKNLKRRLSVRECARLQTFPDDYEFLGSMGNMYMQIGNAVPSLLAEKISGEIKKNIK